LIARFDFFFLVLVKETDLLFLIGESEAFSLSLYALDFSRRPYLRPGCLLGNALPRGKGTYVSPSPTHRLLL
jgi:hypothetical protein